MPRMRSRLFSVKVLCFENKIIQSTLTDKSRDVKNEIYWFMAHIITLKMRQTENIRITVLSNFQLTSTAADAHPRFSGPQNFEI